MKFDFKSAAGIYLIWQFYTLLPSALPVAFPRPTPASSSSAVSKLQFGLLTRYTVKGQEIKSLEKGDAECKSECAATKGCQAVIMVRGQNCRLVSSLSDITEDNNADIHVAFRVERNYMSLDGMKFPKVLAEYKGPIEECGRVCDNLPGCRGYSYAKSTQNVCKLVSEVADPTYDDSMITEIFMTEGKSINIEPVNNSTVQGSSSKSEVAGSSASNSAETEPASNSTSGIPDYIKLPGIDYPSSSLATKEGATPEACATSCTKEVPGCIGFVMDAERCLFKDKLIGFGVAVSARSTYVQKPKQNKSFTEKKGFTIKGDDLAVLQASQAECAAACTVAPGCMSYVIEGGSCLLKHEKETPVESADSVLFISNDDSNDVMGGSGSGGILNDDSNYDEADWSGLDWSASGLDEYYGDWSDQDGNYYASNDV